MTKATALDSGCWVDGHWGQYAIAHMVDKASSYVSEGMPAFPSDALDIATRHLASMFPHDGEDITQDEMEAMSDISDEVETWLNDNVAPDGYSFGWSDGEFFLCTVEDWSEVQ